MHYLSSHLHDLESFQLKAIYNSTVFSLPSKLSKSKATDLDKISARLLRECSDVISNFLCLIFNRSISTGIFPDEWKCAKVLPLFKQGCCSELNNYRPVSIIPIVAKVMMYITNHNLISNCQSGFRSLHSTATTLLETVDSWAYNTDRGCVNAVVFLDLKKAFDTVDHDILLTKLNTYGIRGVVHNWFKSYLKDRQQKCFVNGRLSESRALTCGVPQGTILGPLLFLLYINDLPNCHSHSQPRMFADDTHLTFADNDITKIERHLNDDLTNISQWLIVNKLTLNMSKTEFMVIGSRQRLYTFDSASVLLINGAPVKQVESTKLLVLNTDEHLSWSVHVDAISKKIASGLGALKRIRPFVPLSTLHTIFYSLNQPHFDYWSVVWGNCNKTFAAKLQKLQNRSARILTFSSYDTNADCLLEGLGWKNLATQRQIQKSIMLYKSVNGLTPEYLCSKFSERSCASGYSLRDTTGKLAVPFPRTNYLKNSFSSSGAVTWNSLPLELRQANF